MLDQTGLALSQTAEDRIVEPKEAKWVWNSGVNHDSLSLGDLGYCALMKVFVDAEAEEDEEQKSDEVS